jgi:DNA-binding XRE family transcriptional regulator
VRFLAWSTRFGDVNTEMVSFAWCRSGVRIALAPPTVGRAFDVWRAPNNPCDMAWEAVLTALGQQLHYLRESAGMTQAEVARRLGVNRSHIYNVKHGRDRPSTKIGAFYEEQFHGNGQAWGLYNALVTADPPPRRKSLDDPSPYPIPGDASTFVDDVTVPCGTEMPPYYEFKKIWRIRNSGTVPWVGRWLRRVGTPTGHGIPTSPYRVRILIPSQARRWTSSCQCRHSRYRGTRKPSSRWSTIRTGSTSRTATPLVWLSRSV